MSELHQTNIVINQVCVASVILVLTFQCWGQEEEDELDALKSAKELEEEKKKDKERQAKLVRRNIIDQHFLLFFYI